MRAFQITGPGVGTVEDVPAPRPEAGEVIVEVAYVGICGTDLGIFHPEPGRLEQIRSGYPLRLGHEWSGTVTEVGRGVDGSWIGRRVTGDTMLGCGHCERCRDGRHHLCEDRYEIGVRRGMPGALAEKLVVPASALHALPDQVSDIMGALVEPAGNSWRAVHAARPRAGSRTLILGSGTIGLLCAQFALAAGSEVHVLGIDPASLRLATTLGVTGAWGREDLPSLRWDAVIDATDAPSMPQFAIDVAEPGRRVVLIGVAHSPSEIDSRVIVRKDLKVVGILGASQGLDPAIEAFAAGTVDPLPLVGTLIGLSGVAAVLDGQRPDAAGAGPKILVDPHRN
ncbi:MAG: alcohol dehydrogenase catalytic domain-containing protein [Actinomycetota bacterium]|nr:alcohol dehydrogenase catalytic domain-containing protein [Actinomycetota bacterium]